MLIFSHSSKSAEKRGRAPKHIFRSLLFLAGLSRQLAPNPCAEPSLALSRFRVAKLKETGAVLAETIAKLFVMTNPEKKDPNQCQRAMQETIFPECTGCNLQEHSGSAELRCSLVSQPNTLYFYPALSCAPRYLSFPFATCQARQGEQTFADHPSLAQREGCPAPQGDRPGPQALLSPSAPFQMSPAPAQPAWGLQPCRSLQHISDQAYR